MYNGNWSWQNLIGPDVAKLDWLWVVIVLLYKYSQNGGQFCQLPYDVFKGTGFSFDYLTKLIKEGIPLAEHVIIASVFTAVKYTKYHMHKIHTKNVTKIHKNQNLIFFFYYLKL